MILNARRTALVVTLLALAGTAQADTILMFENHGQATLNNSGFGSNASTTPDITVSYDSYLQATPSTTGNLTSFNVANDYGTLAGFAYTSANTYVTQIGFTAASGVTGEIESFNLASYSTPRTSPYIQIVDASNDVLWSSTDLAPSATTYTSYTPDLTFTGTVYLQIARGYTIGIDDVAFSEMPASVPEPSTIVLMGLGLGAMGLVRLRRRSASATR